MGVAECKAAWVAALDAWHAAEQELLDCWEGLRNAEDNWNKAAEKRTEAYRMLRAAKCKLHDAETAPINKRCEP